MSHIIHNGLRLRGWKQRDTTRPKRQWHKPLCINIYRHATRIHFARADRRQAHAKKASPHHPDKQPRRRSAQLVGCCSAECQTLNSRVLRRYLSDGSEGCGATVASAAFGRRVQQLQVRYFIDIYIGSDRQSPTNTLTVMMVRWADHQPPQISP